MNVSLNMIKSLFTYLPIAVFVATYFLFVRTSRFSRRARWVWTVVLAVSCLKFLCFEKIGGDAFYPDFPQGLVWLWNWAYSASIILFGLSIVWWGRGRKWLLPLIAATTSAIGLYNGVSAPRVTNYEFAFADLPASLDGYRIVQVSDTHVSCAARRWRTERVVDTANAQKADLICLTGDFADGDNRLYADDVRPFKRLKAKDGVLCITGNHEYYFTWKKWKRTYEKLGMKFLVNACAHPRANLAVGGVNDEAAGWLGRRRFVQDIEPDVRKAFATATNGEFRVLLQHRPGRARENAKELGVRLQLSGHTHGGIMPVLSGLVRKENNGFVRGTYEVGGGSWLLVNSGAGQWAGFPMRFFTPSEIAVITLRKL